jgi:hypothetical protein
MPLLKDRDRQALVQEFSQMPGRVRIVFFTQALGCETCGVTEQILTEIEPLSDKLELVIKNFAIDRDAVQAYAIARIPAFAIVRLEQEPGTDGETEFVEHDYGIRFYGVPSGHEFMSLIGAILDVSTGDSQLSPASRALAAHITAPTHIQVFTTPT